MAPGTHLVALDVEDPPEVNLRTMAVSPHPPPVYRGSLDTLVGIVSVKHVWARTVAVAIALFEVVSACTHHLGVSTALLLAAFGAVWRTMGL